MPFGGKKQKREKDKRKCHFLKVFLLYLLYTLGE
jgi:hypothetical protein